LARLIPRLRHDGKTGDADDEPMLLREDGQTMTEYGVTLAVITPLVIVAFTLLSTRIFDMVSRTVGLLP
jgi:Flp pilus assembly pilin Flp